MTNHNLNLISTLTLRLTQNVSYNCLSLQTNLGPVLIAVNSFDQVQSKTGLLQSMSDNQRLQKIIQMVTSKLANSSTPQVIVLRYILHFALIRLFPN